jgi:hypothetical protein
LKHYLKAYYDEFKKEKVESFDEFYNSIIDKFELECLKGGVIYYYWCVLFLIDLVKDK